MFKLFQKKPQNPSPQNEVVQDEQNTLEPKPKKLSKTKKIIIAITSFILVVAIAISCFAFNWFYVKKDYETVASFANLPEPVQIETTGGVSKTIDDYTINIEFKAAYTIVGRVLDTKYYFPYKMVNKLSCFDIGLGWGPLSEHEYDDYISFESTNRRSLSYKYKTELISKLGSKEAFADRLSNNHIIHANETVLKCIRNVKKDQYIKLEGYLAYVSYSNNGFITAGEWNSSLSRSDHGDGACEVFYVTSVKWLKSK